VSLIQDARDQVAARLDDLDATVYPLWPTEVAPPLVWITPTRGEGFISNGAPFGTYLMALDVVIAVEHGDIATSFAALDPLVEQAVTALSDYPLVGVDAPAPVTLLTDGAEYLGTVIHIQVPFALS
jgi:hypothetical protein